MAKGQGQANAPQDDRQHDPLETRLGRVARSSSAHGPCKACLTRPFTRQLFSANSHFHASVQDSPPRQKSPSRRFRDLLSPLRLLGRPFRATASSASKMPSLMLSHASKLALNASLSTSRRLHTLNLQNEEGGFLLEISTKNGTLGLVKVRSFRLRCISTR